MTGASHFREELRRLRLDRGLSYRALAGRSHYSPSYIDELEKGRKPPNETVAERLDQALDADGRLVAILRRAGDGVDDEIEAIELARRVTASDVSGETLDQLEAAFDRMAMAYATTPPIILLPRIRRHLAYVGSLLDARKTLAEQQRLFVIGGLAVAAARHPACRSSAGRRGGCPPVHRGGARRADRPPRDRRLGPGDPGVGRADQFRYDPAKAHSYAATTLAWAGDPAAEAVAREVIAELRAEGARPRRIASAQLDLGLALLAAGKPDEAADEARRAITSGRIVASNWWRVAEVVSGVRWSGTGRAEDLRDLAIAHRPRSLPA